jgi:hypothetical protein
MGQGVFQVNEKKNQYIVELGTRHCDYQRWDLTGVPYESRLEGGG